MPVKLAFYQAAWNLAGAGWTDLTPYVIEASGGGELSGNRDNAVAFGDSSETSASVTLTDAYASFAWQRQSIRLTFAINGTPAVSFAGIMTKRTRNSQQGTMTFECHGYAELLRTTKAYSRLIHRRPIATKTTASSVEDPTDLAWRGGAMNFILWSAGGRPYEQDFAYPSAVFYYSCDQALIAPLWSWTAGEDGWEECLRLAQASGGQVYQGLDGVVRYRQPYAIADASATYTFSEDVYGPDGVTEEEGTDQFVTQVSCTYVQRQLRAMQEIVKETNSRILGIGETQVVVIEPSWPIYAIDLDSGGNLKSECFVVSFPWFGAATLNTDYSVGLDWQAQRITLTFENLSNCPLVIWSYSIKGQPVVAGMQGNVTVGSGETQRKIGDSPYIQTEHDARRLCKLTLKFYGATQPLRSISACAYDPARTVGEVVALTNARLGLTASPHIILSISHSDTGLFSDYTLCYVGDLPVASEYYQVGPTYGASKKLTV
jgi:hypothetical protein